MNFHRDEERVQVSFTSWNSEKPYSWDIENLRHRLPSVPSGLPTTPRTSLQSGNKGRSGPQLRTRVGWPTTTTHWATTGMLRWRIRMSAGVVRCTRKFAPGAGPLPAWQCILGHGRGKLRLSPSRSQARCRPPASSRLVQTSQFDYVLVSQRPSKRPH